MRLFILCLFSFLWTTATYAQSQRAIQKSWIKVSVDNLSDGVMEPDTLYTRYSFDRSILNISFYPAWNTYEQPWLMQGNMVKIGFDTYKIDELSDTSLMISLAGFRRVRFLSEEYLSNQDKHLVIIGTYNGKPLYKANNFITPRYAGKFNFRDRIQKSVERFHIRKANYFLATFIITEEGRVEEVKVIKGINEDFDQEIVKQLSGTSKKWRPAYFKGAPIQTEMFYDIRYLDSIVPDNFGILN